MGDTAQAQVLRRVTLFIKSLQGAIWVALNKDIKARVLVSLMCVFMCLMCTSVRLLQVKVVSLQQAGRTAGGPGEDAAAGYLSSGSSSGSGDKEGEGEAQGEGEEEQGEEGEEGGGGAEAVGGAGAGSTSGKTGGDSKAWILRYMADQGSDSDAEVRDGEWAVHHVWSVEV